MEKTVVTKTDILRAAKMRTRSWNWLMIISMAVVGLGAFGMILVSGTTREPESGGLIPVLLGSMVIEALLGVVLYNSQKKFKAVIENRQYQILLQTVARKEIDDAGETTAYTLFLADGKRLVVNSKDYRIARPGECYYFVLRNDNMALLGMFNAQFYRMDEE